MKSSLLGTYLLWAVCSFTADAWGLPQTRRQLVQDVAKAAGIAAGITVSPAAADAAAPKSIFTHQYNDPKHPNCKRIVVVKDFGEASISGTDGTPGCPEDGEGKVWRLVGQVEGDKILVDFSPKGGPANLKGVWDPKEPAGIKWPDGNKWTVKD